MKIQELFSITELSRLLNKSRPSTYKYISDYEKDDYDNIPKIIKELFDNVESGKFNKSNVYDYCYQFMLQNNQQDLKAIYELLNENKNKLDLIKIKEYILKELSNEQQ